MHEPIGPPVSSIDPVALAPVASADHAALEATIPQLKAIADSLTPTHIELIADWLSSAGLEIESDFLENAVKPLTFRPFREVAIATLISQIKEAATTAGFHPSEHWYRPTWHFIWHQSKSETADIPTPASKDISTERTLVQKSESNPSV